MSPEYKAWVNRMFDLWMRRKDAEVLYMMSKSPSRVVLGLRDGVLLHERVESESKGNKRE